MSPTAGDVSASRRRSAAMRRRPGISKTSETLSPVTPDARYMIWTMDLLDGADHLIAEMGLTPTLP
jgi:hypothetical protein